MSAGTSSGSTAKPCSELRKPASSQLLPQPGGPCKAMRAGGELVARPGATPLVLLLATTRPNHSPKGPSACAGCEANANPSCSEEAPCHLGACSKTWSKAIVSLKSPASAHSLGGTPSSNTTNASSGAGPSARAACLCHSQRSTSFFIAEAKPPPGSRDAPRPENHLSGRTRTMRAGTPASALARIQVLAAATLAELRSKLVASPKAAAVRQATCLPGHNAANSAKAASSRAPHATATAGTARRLRREPAAPASASAPLPASGAAAPRSARRRRWADGEPAAAAASHEGPAVSLPDCEAATNRNVVASEIMPASCLRNHLPQS
mmetsp:Transcript_16357/g.57173  ORF Transcript_16357/g.57173 Transcript_16357/m.57173 type:complete len:323 (+) Transcript_16357:299-1267(+)